ncbi:MAG: ACT domain-containing protein, partial [Myxococcales bacterium]
MHLLTGRADAKFLCERQRPVAARLGYKGARGASAVEQLMRQWYTAGSVLRRAADQVIERTEQQVRRIPLAERALDHEFSIAAGRLTCRDQRLFERAPAAIVRLFAAADREGVPVDPDTLESAAARLDRIDDAVRASPPVVATVRQMFLRPGTRGEFLETMHQASVLRALFPELSRLTVRFQPAPGRAYTADVHGIRLVRRLYALRAGELLESEPELTRLSQALPRPFPLFLAPLFCDSGGRGTERGTAERSAQLMRQAAERLGIATRDASDAEFLVRHHPLMAHVSQRRDLSDPQTIESFARACGDVERMTLLLLQTYAALATGAEGGWSDWRARLLRELYEKARGFLEGKWTGSPDHLERLRTGLRDALLQHFPAQQVERFLSTMPERYVRTAGPDDAIRHLRILRRVRKAPLAAWLRHRASYTELSLCAGDRPGLLALFTAVLAAHGIDIHRARVFTTTDRRAIAEFVIGSEG